MKTILIITIVLIVICLIFLVLPCIARKTTEPPFKTVKHVDIERYMGVWYEIARFPHRFERDLVGVTAIYKLQANGRISVLNQGYKYTLDGKHKKAKGRARIPNPDFPGYLQVSFFLCFWADYLILELDKDYQYVLVGSSSSNYLWILARTPEMQNDVYDTLVHKAAELGYDVRKLEKVVQRN
jgi:apolipoprotein D and lipocalin family protein